MEYYIGIDLGTTNSAICTFDKETQQIRVWKSPEQNDVTPSAIYLDSRGNEYIGQRAYNAAPRSPDNCATLFKRFMGTTTPIELSAVNHTFTPEECSSKVLKTLFGYLPEEIRNTSETATVITVPAAFNQMQKNATMTAAEASGIGRVELVQEPVAAVMSYMKASGGTDGIFLIYDLGGGTLDVAIAESIRKRVSILAHGGIQMCGGRDFDRTLVDNIVRPWLHENFELPDDLSTNPTFKPLQRLATWATERAKIELSAKDEVMISLSEVELRTNDLNGDEIYLEIPLHRNTYDNLIENQTSETIDAARETLSKTGYTPNDIESIIWVGGPTHYKPLRDKVSFELGIKGERIDVNPMTAVAEGASIWAESVNWDTEKDIKPVTETVDHGISFKYRDQTPDDTTRIAVHVDGQESAGSTFQIRNLDDAWTSGAIALKHGETVEVNLTKSGENTFKITVYDASGKTTKQEEISIRKVDIFMDKIPSELSFALDVVRKIGEEPIPKFLVKEGELLPKEGEITVYAAETLESGSSNSLNFKLREIDSLGNNKPIAVLRIEGSDLDEGSIQANTPLKCIYEKTRGGYIKFEVEVEGINGTFNNVLYIDEDLTPDAIQVAEKGRQILARIDRIDNLIGNDTKLNEARKKVESTITLEPNADSEKVLKANQDNQIAQKLLSQAENEPENVKNIRQIRLDDTVKFFDVYIRQFARSTEASEFDKLAETAQRSIDNNDAEFNDQINELRGRNFQILWRQDWFVIEQFNHFADSPHLFADKDRFEELVHVGKQLLKHPEIQDILSGKRQVTIKSEVVEELRKVVVQIMEIPRTSGTASQDEIRDLLTNILAERSNVDTTSSQ